MATSSAAGARDRLTVGTHQDGNDHVVRASGELDMATTGALEDELRRTLERPAGSIVLDLDGITFIDSTGLRILLWAASRSHEKGHRLSIHCGGAPVRRMLEVTQLDRSLPLAA
jgi:anti-sigma B factor antagonist